MVSDNAKTFKTIGKNLKQLYDHPEVRAELECMKVEWNLEWKFILERAPNWGGFYERLGLTKRCLKKVLGNDELHIILVEIEGTLNARPLTYVSSELEEEILTPAHLLYGRNINSLLDYPVEKEGFKEKDLGARYKYLTERLVHFWSRWKSEYLVNLREHRRSDSKVGKNFVKVGDMILLGDDIHEKRNDWRFGVVQNCIKGKDNEVRGAENDKTCLFNNATVSLDCAVSCNPIYCATCLYRVDCFLALSSLLRCVSIFKEPFVHSCIHVYPWHNQARRSEG